MQQKRDLKATFSKQKPPWKKLPNSTSKKKNGALRESNLEGELKEGFKSLPTDKNGGISFETTES